MNFLTKAFATLLVGCVLGSSQAIAAFTVYFYGINAANDTNPNPSPLLVVPTSVGNYIAGDGGVNLTIAGGFSDPFLYRANSSFIPAGQTGNALYYTAGEFIAGAVSGDQNFAYLRFVGGSYFNPFESIGQFYFDEQGTGRLIAIATTNTGTTAANIRGNADGIRVTVAQGATAIAAAQIPEPTSMFLIAIGSLSMIIRRCRSATFSGFWANRQL